MVASEIVLSGQNTAFALPIDFESESVDYTFTDFGNAFAGRIDNPDPSGINTTDETARMQKFAAESMFTFGGSNLTLAEAAMLAGLPQAPAYWDPYTNWEGAKRRQAVVLDLMVKQGYIDEEQARMAKVEKLYFASAPFDIHAPHFVMYVRGLLEQELGLHVARERGDVGLGQSLRGDLELAFCLPVPDQLHEPGLHARLAAAERRCRHGCALRDRERLLRSGRRRPRQVGRLRLEPRHRVLRTARAAGGRGSARRRGRRPRRQAPPRSPPRPGSAARRYRWE